ncbi:MAG: T9SS type A sorting domain-containing protein [Bacteroidetes bacterium]|nr:T9SS type A sorting domain-containing protein [Bacteroidota bacterium]
MKTSWIITFFGCFTLLSIHNRSACQSTVISIADGNWTNPATWDCNCIPLPGDVIIVNSDVVLDMNWSTDSSLTVTPGSSLIENGTRTFAVYGSFINNGTVDISRFGVWGGSVINNDSMRINQAFYNDAEFENHDRLVDIDSMTNAGTLKNLDSAYIFVQLYTNSDSMVNEGTIMAGGHTNMGKSYNSGTLNFTDYTNAGTAYNSGTLFFNDFTNAITGTFNNSALITGTNDFLNAGTFSNLSTGSFTIARDFYNSDGTAPGWALFLNNGFVEVGDDWLNVDSVFGSTGRFCIQDSTANTGMMAGTFDFCDKTPPASQPFIDFNTGTIRPGITWCTQSCNTGVTELRDDGYRLRVYPNPAIKSYIKIVSAGDPIYKIEVFDINGRMIVSKDDFSGNDFNIELTDFQKGFYLFRVNDKPIQKIIVE